MTARPPMRAARPTSFFTSFALGLLVPAAGMVTLSVLHGQRRLPFWALVPLGASLMPGALLPTLAELIIRECTGREPAIIAAVAASLAGVVVDAALWGTLFHRIRSGTLPKKTLGGNIVEWIVVVEVVASVAAPVLPSLLGSREKARIAACDAAYVELNDEIAGGLEALRDGKVLGNDCKASSVPGLLSCVVAGHSDRTNPRNAAQPAYVTAAPDACQVQLSSASERRVLVRQQLRGDSWYRTFSIHIE